MAAGKKDFILDQGATWAPVITYKDPSGIPVDLTGWDARLVAKSDYDSDAVIQIDTVNGGITIEPLVGEIKPVVSASQSAAIPQGTLVYDLEIYAGDIVHKLLIGAMTVRREVSR